MLETFLNKSHSPYHAVAEAQSQLEAAGFIQTDMAQITTLSPGKYYIKPCDTALFALVLPNQATSTMHIATAHTDFPTFKVKPVPDMAACGGCQRINTEPYGGMLSRTWFDRPLGIAGAIWMAGENEFSPVIRLVDIDQPTCFIPSLAPHMDREIETKKIDPQKELIPVWNLESEASLLDLIAKHAVCSADEILSFDLNLFACGDAVIASDSSQFIMSQRIDNIASVAALIEAVVDADLDSDYMSMVCLFDNEEIGSRTKQGADSNTLGMMLDQLNVDYQSGFILSVDGAHALHPNYPEKADPSCQVILGQGLAIKTSASQRYATDGRMIAILRGICQKHDIPYQIQANKSGAPGGSTLGPIVSSHIPMAAADLGIPMLAMHSICETAAITDYQALVKLARTIL